MLIVKVRKFLLRFWPFHYRPSEVELMMAEDNQELHELNRALMSQLRRMKEKLQSLEAEIELLRRRRHGQC